MRRIAPWLTALLLGAALPPAGALGKFEPQQGCYLGAYIEQDRVSAGDITTFESLTGKKHASYFRYVGYGQPFPKDWVAKVKAAGASPSIAWEPNGGLGPVRDDDYLRQWARDASAADCPIFLRYASEMNGTWMAYSGNPREYVTKFRLVHDVMAQEAPNVAMVWTPFATPQAMIPAYYPGDRYVDWVGVNIYSVVVHNANLNEPGGEDPAELLRYVYDRYSLTKPIQISEYGATHFCAAVKQDTTDFAVRYMTRLYEALPREFPRVKAVYYFCVEAARHGLAHNDYSFTNTRPMLQAYQRLVSDPHFLGAGPDLSMIPPEPVGEPEGPRLPEPIEPGGILVTVQGSPIEAARGTVRLVVQGAPDLVVGAVALYVDGVMAGLTNAQPFAFDWNSTRVANGQHQLRIVVFDGRMTESASREVAITVAN